MKNETLLDKAVQNLRIAQMIRSYMPDDDAYLNHIGYHLQQAVELSLKFQLEMNGVDYPKVHDIDQIIRIAHENNADIILSDYIYEHAEMFSLWEAKTRYILNYRLELNKVVRAMNEIERYLHEIQIEYSGFDDQSVEEHDPHDCDEIER